MYTAFYIFFQKSIVSTNKLRYISTGDFLKAGDVAINVTNIWLQKQELSEGE